VVWLIEAEAKGREEEEDEEKIGVLVDSEK